MIKVQQNDYPVQFITDNDGFLQSAKFGKFEPLVSMVYGEITGLNCGWTPEALRYVADTLEEAQANGGKLVMEITDGEAAFGADSEFGRGMETDSV